MPTIKENQALPDFELPASIYEAVRTRLRHLTLPAQRLLEQASAFGLEFPLTALLSLNDLPPQQILKYIDAILEKALIQELPGGELFQFSHDQIQHVLYSNLSKTRRRLLHYNIANWYETNNIADTKPINQIAYHAYLGEDWALALHYNYLAGQQTQQIHSNYASIDFYEKALLSAQQLPDEETVLERKTIYLGLGQLTLMAGQYKDSESYLRDALVLGQKEQDWLIEARACRWLAHLSERQSEYQTALVWVQKGLKRIADKQSAEKAELLLLAGVVYLRRGEFNRAFTQCQQSLQVGQHIDDKAIIARAYNLWGILHSRQGNNASAQQYYEMSLDNYKQLNDILGQAKNL